MINFFRKIRRRLADDNQFLKYSRYAIGEIVLVVIGILIALQVNNWKEKRQVEKRIVSLFKNVLNELDSNIEKTDELMRYYKPKDSMLWLVNHKKVNRDDYRSQTSKSYDLLDLTVTYEKIYLKKNSYDNLLVYVEDIPEEYKTALKFLDELNNDLRNEVDRYNVMLEDFVEKTRYNDALERSWYANSSNQLDPLEKENQIDFYLNNFRYFNRSERYRQITNSLLIRSIKYRQQAEVSYQEIVKLLPEYSVKNAYFIPVELRKSLIGKYKLEGTPDVIYKVDELEKKLYYKTNFDYEESKEIFYCRNNSLMTEDGAYFDLHINENDTIISSHNGYNFLKLHTIPKE